MKRYDKLRIDTAGQSGRAGMSGAPGAPGNEMGGRGFDGNPGENGHTGENVELTVRSAQDDKKIVVSKADEDFLLEETGAVEINTRGGNGGNGGHGGIGGPGGRGEDGDDATTLIPGDPGVQGWQGGPGGNGGNGGNAGAGGNVSINLRAEDLSLLLVFDDIDTRPGKIGRQGKAGPGGAGGEGGDGGEPYIWETSAIETYPLKRTRLEKILNFLRIKHTPKQATHQVVKVNESPAGKDGAIGKLGEQGKAGLAGLEATSGNIAYRVTEHGKVTEYQSPYHLKINKVNICQAHPDGIYEPGENLSIEVVVENSGQMPSPPNQQTLVYIECDALVENFIQVRLKKSLAPGEIYTLPEKIQVSLKDEYQADEQPIAEHDQIAFKLFDDRVKRLHPDTAFSLNFDVSNPVELHVDTKPISVAPGLPATFLLTATNQSQLPIGKKANRDVNLVFSVQDSDNAEIACANRTDREQVTVPVKLLNPHQSRKYEVNLSVNEHAQEPQVEVACELWLKALHDRGYRCVQRVQHPVSVSERYQHPEHVEFDVLLLVNQNTSKQEINTWRSAAADLELKLALWDLTLYGDFELGKIYPQLQHELREDLPGKIIVATDTPINGDLKLSSMLSLEELHRLMIVSGTKCLVMGGQQDISELLLQQHSTPECEVQDLDDLVDRENKRNQSGLGGYRMTVKQTQVRLENWHEKTLANKAKQIAKRLRDEFPERRYCVSYHFEQTDEQTFGPMKKATLGEIHIAPTLDRYSHHFRQNNHVRGELSQYVSEHPTQVVSELLMIISFDKKIELLQDSFRYPNLLTEAFLTELIEEVDIYRTTKNSKGFRAKDVVDNLNCLQKLLRLEVSDDLLKDKVGTILMTFKLSLLNQMKLTHFLSPKNQQRSLTHHVAKAIDEWTENHLTRKQYKNCKYRAETRKDEPQFTFKHLSEKRLGGYSDKFHKSVTNPRPC